MNVQGRRNQHQQGRCGRECERLSIYRNKVAKAVELLALMMPFHAQPIVEPLQRQVNVFVGLQLDYREPPISRAGQQIDHSAIGSCEGGNLRVYTRGIETCIEPSHVALDLGFQPALRLHAPQWMAFVSVGPTQLAQTLYQLFEQRIRLRREHSLMRTAAQDNLVDAGATVGGRRNARTRELETMQAEPELGRAQHNRFSFRDGSANALSRRRKSLLNAQRVRTAHQSRCDVPLIGEIERLEPLRTFVELIQLEADGGTIKVVHARLNDGGATGRNKQPQALHYRSRGFAFTAIVKPKHRKGKRSVDRRLYLRVVDAQDATARAPTSE